ncbi:unnamed protein product [Effrenium voratum]|nr:unnamed protein product [Effrenium voratum]
MSIPGDAPQNLLRPEAAEAVWYMWYYTGDPKYRQWGHEMFLPFLKYSKAKFGFTAIGDVRKRNPPKRDSQESFWLGETLKYFYLIFAPRSTLNLEDRRRMALGASLSVTLALCSSRCRRHVPVTWPLMPGYNGPSGSSDVYRWANVAPGDEVEVEFDLPEPAKAADVEVQIRPSHVRVKIQGKVLVDDDLLNRCDHQMSRWEIRGTRLVVVLQKEASSTIPWPNLGCKTTFDLADEFVLNTEAQPLKMAPAAALSGLTVHSAQGAELGFQGGSGSSHALTKIGPEFVVRMLRQSGAGAKVGPVVLRGLSGPRCPSAASATQTPSGGLFVLYLERYTLHLHKDLAPVGIFAKLRASDTKLSSAPALRLPRAWALLGPWTFSDGEPLDAFGGVQNVARRAPEALWQTLRAGNTSLPDVLRKQLEAFPTEVGPAGQTTWALTFSNGTARTVPVNFTAAAVAAGWNAGDFSPETGHGRGWAMGEMELEQDAKVLAKCSDSFMVGDGGPLLADAYGENRSVHVLHLPRGRHQIYVSAGEPGFWCDFLLDSAAARGIMTNVETDKVSPLIIMKDSVVSEVVASNLVSPHLGIPVLNAEKKGLRLTNVTIVQGANLTVELGQQPIVQPGQVLILRLLLRQQGELVCNGSVLDLALALHTDTGTTLANLQTTCRTKPWRGFLVAYPDFDGSIQKLWAAPPNVSRFADRRCPARGCPVLLSLHGASVSLGNLWGHSYESHEEGFPYGAWLVQPTNRYHWGTDWEGPGLDNAPAALDYVRDQLPGIDGGREDFGLDDQRVLVTGHSMGGHGCFVFATHFPDRLLGAACASGYPSLRLSLAHLFGGALT